MRFLWVGAATLLFVVSCTGFAQTAGTCSVPFEAPMQSGSSLSIESRSAAIQVVGTDQEIIRVSCTLNDPEQAKEINLRLSGAGAYSKLTLKGGTLNNISIRIEVPRKIGLNIHTPAGEVNVDQVAGDKNIDIHAGEITVSNVNGSQYRYVKASVQVGEVSASAFGVEKGGFLRSFTKETPGGQYRLRAHVVSGSIVLN